MRLKETTLSANGPSPIVLHGARVVVTGGAGFLGSHVADALTASGCDTSVFDRVTSNRAATVIGDLSDLEGLMRAFDGADFVCHLAAVGDVYLAAEQPALAASVNVAGTANVCEAALRSRTRRVVLASTWEVYGRPRYEPIDEDHPCDPDHPYSVTKLAGELLAKSYAHLRGLDVVSLRLGTAFGTRMRANSVFQIFIRRALSGEGIVVQGSGKQARQFTHASDIGRAFVAALERSPAASTYNIVSDENTSILELAEAVSELVPTAITFGSSRPGDVPSAKVSNDRARRELGWAPMTNLRTGLQEIVAELR
jgi:UDP-glucose 4-epimerase